MGKIKESLVDVIWILVYYMFITIAPFVWEIVKVK